MPSDPSILIEMARMYEESGDITMAQQCYLDVRYSIPNFEKIVFVFKVVN